MIGPDDNVEMMRITGRDRVHLPLGALLSTLRRDPTSRLSLLATDMFDRMLMRGYCARRCFFCGKLTAYVMDRETLIQPVYSRPGDVFSVRYVQAPAACHRCAHQSKSAPTNDGWCLVCADPQWLQDADSSPRTTLDRN